MYCRYYCVLVRDSVATHGFLFPLNYTNSQFGVQVNQCFRGALLGANAVRFHGIITPAINQVATGAHERGWISNLRCSFIRKT